MTNLNPLKAMKQAWSEIEREFESDSQAPAEVLRARESVEAMRDLRSSFKNITREKKRLKARSQ
jgi:hypothetical protein